MGICSKGLETWHELFSKSGLALTTSDLHNLVQFLGRSFLHAQLPQISLKIKNLLPQSHIHRHHAGASALPEP
jgi:hypothetical protein